MKILAINCGSSSIKFTLFKTPGYDILVTGIIEKIGLLKSEIRIHSKKGSENISEEAIPDHGEGIKYILNILTGTQDGCLSDLDELNAVGHRVAHGGNKYKESILIDEEVISEIKNHSDLAPLHNPHNLKGIEAVRQLIPGVKQIAVFDTAFHHTIPDYAYMYAIPYLYYEKYKIRRYGFHGTSHYYVSKRACEILDLDINKQKIITCHLGNGSSMAAIRNGKSIDTSMGFTPAEGLIMGTRPGDLDVSILPYIMKKEGIDCEHVNHILNEQSGILGVSGISSDMREIESAITCDKNDRAILTREMFFYRIKKYIGAYTAVLNGLDILVFTGGIGENCHEIQTGVCHNLEYLGIKIKPETLSSSTTEERIISSDDSRVSVMVIPTNEELVIAEKAIQIITDSKLNKNAS